MNTCTVELYDATGTTRHHSFQTDYSRGLPVGEWIVFEETRFYRIVGVKHHLAAPVEAGDVARSRIEVVGYESSREKYEATLLANSEGSSAALRPSELA